MTVFRSLLLATFLFGLNVGSATAASFDCDKATTKTEIAICDNPELGAIDELISIFFTLSLEKSVRKDVVFQEQKNWLEQRNLVLSDDSDLYELRPCFRTVSLLTLCGHFPSHIFKCLLRCLVADAGVAALSVVEDLNIFKDCSLSLGASSEALAMDQLLFSMRQKSSPSVHCPDIRPSYAQKLVTV